MERDPNTNVLFPVVRTLDFLIPPIEERFLSGSQFGTGGDVIYYGWADLGTDQDTPKWRIMKESATAGDGTVTIVREFPNSDQTYSFAWSDRASLNYSR